jgi:hypothetical protein
MFLGHPLRGRFYLSPEDGAGGGIVADSGSFDSGGSDDFGSGIPDAPEQSVQLGQEDQTLGVPEQAPAFSFREYAKTQGLGSLAGLASEQEAAERVLGQLIQLHNQNQQYQPLVQQYQQIVPRWSEFQKWEAQQAQAAQQKQQAPQKPLWEAPEYDPRWQQMVRKDEYGNVIPVNGAAPDLPQKIAKYNEFVRDKFSSFMKDPAAFMEPLLEGAIQKRIDDKLGGYRQELEAKQSIQSFINDNADWLYERDANGQVVRAQNGQPLYSEYGRDLQNNVNNITQLFNANRAGQVPDHELIKNLGMAMTTAVAQAKAQAAQQVPQQQQQMDPRQRATGVPPARPPVRKPQSGNSLTGALTAANGAGLDSPDLRASLRSAFTERGLLSQFDES